ncbi:MAG: ACT domain-containing protein, partial [bacterium]|nr:ACT domain-containing protein [bacterium]
VRGPFNAVSVYGHAVGHTLYYGRGAGAGPTASAVVADVIDVAARSSGGGQDQVQSRRGGSDEVVQYQSLDALCGRYYVRFMVQDRPGVIADITRVFADEGISLSAITQRDPHDETCSQVVTITVITHRAQEGALRRAFRTIEGIDAVTETPVAIRIIDEHEEF